jgi:hydrogenase expression/formation protein HypD
MHIEQTTDFRSPDIAKRLIDRIAAAAQPVRLMEVCGTHTVSIFRSGIRSMLPDVVELISGPGCPVCVTAQGEIDAFITLSRRPDVVIATFGDLMRVPGTRSSLQQEKAEGRDVRVVYSTLDAVRLAATLPEKEVVFLGIGFETTAPTIAASILAAEQRQLTNYTVYSAHKRVPPALEALMTFADVRIDGLILPGHVSVIIGVDGYRTFFQRHRTPCVVTGFEPIDILTGIQMLVDQIRSRQPKLENAYPRAVTAAGNTAAQHLLETVFVPVDATWRGLGPIPDSGLRIRDAFARFDAAQRFAVNASEAVEPAGCACGDILTGSKTPPQCPLYNTVCTPSDPVGPCMVSSEGTCAAFHRYQQPI